MELRHIRYFIRAAELQHFTQAAESLYISQPTLSTHIQQLEEEVGLPLFNRLGRKVHLTEAGRILFEHAVQSLRELERATEEIADLRGIVSGTLRIGALQGISQGLLPIWLSEFNPKYPEVHLEIVTATSGVIEEGLKSGSMDVGLSSVPTTAPGIDSELLFEQQPCLVVSAQHPLATRKQVEMAELSTLPLAFVGKRFAARATIESALTDRDISLNIVVEVDDLQALLKLVSSSEMATILSPLVTADYPNIRKIAVVGLPTIYFGVLWRSGVHLGPPVKAFLTFLKKAGSSESELPNTATGGHS